MNIESFNIDDDLNLADKIAIEVTLSLKDGSKRWCFFTVPDSLKNFGDFLPESEIRARYNMPHMIVVDKINESIISKALQLLDAEDLIYKCSLPLK